MAKRLTEEINRLKRRLINKAKIKGGVYENFGQVEIYSLKEKYNYSSLVYGSSKDRRRAEEINAFEEWAISYSGIQGE